MTVSTRACVPRAVGGATNASSPREGSSRARARLAAATDRRHAKVCRAAALVTRAKKSAIPRVEEPAAEEATPLTEAQLNSLPPEMLEKDIWVGARDEDDNRVSPVAFIPPQNAFSANVIALDRASPRKRRPVFVC